MKPDSLKHMTWRLSDRIAIVRLGFARLRSYSGYDEIAEELRSVADASLTNKG